MRLFSCFSNGHKYTQDAPLKSQKAMFVPVIIDLIKLLLEELVMTHDHCGHSMP